MIFSQSLTSPLGHIWIEANEAGVTVVKFVDEIDAMANPSALTEQCCRELKAYFARELTTFTVPVAAIGTAFRHSSASIGAPPMPLRYLLATPGASQEPFSSPCELILLGFGSSRNCFQLKNLVQGNPLKGRRTRAKP